MVKRISADHIKPSPPPRSVFVRWSSLSAAANSRSGKCPARIFAISNRNPGASSAESPSRSTNRLPRADSHHALFKKNPADRASSLKRELNDRKVDLIKVDLDTAMTFATIARDSSDQQKTARNAAHARKGYEAIVHFL